ncbi:hypothetical protein A3860_12560 [Niastella vici]|uniref:Iron dicitrate transport regulator FecR n=1 Tax=Niastella vici TaxID=1703345 RepID=A0A1V9G6Q5_9BACT|nr:FecR domain-containing protein [Niastella vici]OQP66329.1 hypothetical protein A3860_12560 [Niastella vici]
MMKLSTEQFQELLEKYLRHEISPEELELFFQAVESQDFQQQLQHTILHQVEGGTFHGASSAGQAEKMYLQWLQQRTNTSGGIKWLRFMQYAAVVILFLGASMGVYRLVHRSGSKATAGTGKNSHYDMAPGGNKAVLLLANGTKVELDSAQPGVLATMGNSHVIKTDSGKLLCKSTGPADVAGNGLNVLSTPRGGTFQVTLADGTRVWLNAESSITYPTCFSKKQRNVSITGEVYFEVAHNAAIPFVVRKGDISVEVLGTHFNINAYGDEEAMKTTLLEGRVKVENQSAVGNRQSAILKPGEQVSISHTSQLSQPIPVQTDEVMAWKNGEMALSHGNVQKLMREVSRWYNVDIEYQGAIPDGKFSGSVNRNVPLSALLNVLKAYGIDTRLNGKKLIVF